MTSKKKLEPKELPWEKTDEETDVTTPPEIILYYRLNHSFWSLSDSKEASR
jgi:hypothetical protein